MSMVACRSGYPFQCGVFDLFALLKLGNGLLTNAQLLGQAFLLYSQQLADAADLSSQVA